MNVYWATQAMKVKNLFEPKKKVLKVGHRGVREHPGLPENTVKAFQYAIENNVDMIEFDIHKCKSHELVINHEPEVIFNGSKRYITDLTLNELQTIDLGNGIKIPTLQEALDCMAGKVKVNIELKGRGVEYDTLEVVEDYVNRGKFELNDFLFTSFDHYQPYRIKQKNKEAVIGALINGIPFNYLANIPEMGAEYVVIALNFLNLEILQDAHKRNLKVATWSVNSQELVDLLVSTNLVDAILTDKADIIKINGK